MLHLKETKIGHHIRLRKNEDLPFWSALAFKQKPPFFSIRMLIMRKIMHSKNVQSSNKV